MKYLQKKSKREKILIIGLLVSTIFSVYVITRVSALNTEIAKQEDKYKLEKKRLEKLNKETLNAVPYSKVEKQVKDMQEKLKMEGKQLEAFDFKFVDLSDEDSLLRQITQITNSAEKNQLRILSKTNEMRPLVSMFGSLANSNLRDKKINNDIGTAQLQRRMYRLKLRGTFHSTYDFIKELQSLDYGVLITQLQITADDKNTYNGLRLVITDITLAI